MCQLKYSKKTCAPTAPQSYAFITFRVWCDHIKFVYLNQELSAKIGATEHNFTRLQHRFCGKKEGEDDQYRVCLYVAVPTLQISIGWLSVILSAIPLALKCFTYRY